MALLQCRDCGAEIDSDSRQTRCKQCGALFPFACTVCGRSLRPPFPVFADERYLTPEFEPLCSDHFERQCPECSQWFRADENPGFFLCTTCAQERQNAPHEIPDWNDPLDEEESRRGRHTRTAVPGDRDPLTIGSWVILAVALSVLAWQLLGLLR